MLRSIEKERSALSDKDAPRSCDPVTLEIVRVTERAAVSAAHSRFVQRIRRRYEAERALLPPGAPGFETIVALVGTLLLVAIPWRIAAILDLLRGAPRSAAMAVARS